MDLRFTFAFVLATWPFGTGCSSTTANAGAADGAAMPDGTTVLSDAESDAAGLGSGCVAAGGRCQATTIACTATSAYGCGSEAQCCFDGSVDNDVGTNAVLEREAIDPFERAWAQ